MDKKYIIYKATNNINGKMYIGKTYNLEKRKKEHISDVNDKLPFHKALKKYGCENFTWEIIDYADSDSEIKEKEIYWIKELKTCIHFPNSNGYNITLGGDGGVSWNSKPIIQFSIEGDYIAEYLSCNHASVETGVERHGISDCIIGKQKISGKFRWMAKEEWDGRKLEPLQLENMRNTKVVQLDLKGNYIATHESIKTASEDTKTPRTSLSGCLNGKNSRANNYIWIYDKDYNPDNDYGYKGHKIGLGILQLDDNYNVIARYNNCSEGARGIGEDTKLHKQIYKSLTNGKRCRGYIWMKYEDYINMKHDNTEVTN